MRNYLRSVKAEWKTASTNKVFLPGCILTIGMLLTIFSITSPFYRFIERRNGHVINDRLLQWLPSIDLSLPIFIIIWASIIFFVIKGLKDPATLLTSLLAYTIFTIIRYFAIYMVPLEPPAGLVVLKDPFTNFIYGGYFVTKDLFFSGHVGTVFLVLLSARTKVQRRVLLVASMVLAFFLLLQHVHYPIDVLASPVFAVASFNLAKLLLGKTKVVTASSLPAGLPIRFGKA